MSYDDFPACLPRYAWLLEKGEQAFNQAGPVPTCKVCGDPVLRPEWNRHLREHGKQLTAARVRERRSATARLRHVNRLRREAASV